MSPSDHDLLITHSGQLAEACKMIKDTKQSLTDFIEKIDYRCETRRTEIQNAQDKTMRTATFWKILTITVIIIMAMMGAMGYNRTISLRNEVRIENLTKLTEMNSLMLHELLQELMEGRK